jgi:hypothetical protein
MAYPLERIVACARDDEVTAGRRSRLLASHRENLELATAEISSSGQNDEELADHLGALLLLHDQAMGEDAAGILEAVSLTVKRLRSSYRATCVGEPDGLSPGVRQAEAEFCVDCSLQRLKSQCTSNAHITHVVLRFWGDSILTKLQQRVAAEVNVAVDDMSSVLLPSLFGAASDPSRKGSGFDARTAFDTFRHALFSRLLLLDQNVAELGEIAGRCTREIGEYAREGAKVPIDFRVVSNILEKSREESLRSVKKQRPWGALRRSEQKHDLVARQLTAAPGHGTVTVKVGCRRVAPQCFPSEQTAMEREALRRLCPPFRPVIKDFLVELTRFSRSIYRESDADFRERDPVQIFSDYIDLFQLYGPKLVAQAANECSASCLPFLLRFNCPISLLQEEDERYLATCNRKLSDIRLLTSQAQAESSLTRHLERLGLKHGPPEDGEGLPHVWIGGAFAGRAPMSLIDGVTNKLASTELFSWEPVFVRKSGRDTRSVFVRFSAGQLPLESFGALTPSPTFVCTTTAKVGTLAKILVRSFFPQSLRPCDTAEDAPLAHTCLGIAASVLVEGTEVAGWRNGHFPDTRHEEAQYKKSRAILMHRRRKPWTVSTVESSAVDPSISAGVCTFFHERLLLLLPSQGSCHGPSARSVFADDVPCSYQSRLAAWIKTSRKHQHKEKEREKTRAGSRDETPPAYYTRAMLRILPSSFQQNISGRCSEPGELLSAAQAWADESATHGERKRKAGVPFSEAFLLEVVPCPQCTNQMQRSSMLLARGDEPASRYWRCEVCLVGLDARKRRM